VALADLTRHASRTGLVGDPTVATAEKGRRFFEVIVAATVEFLAELARREVRTILDFPLRHERTAIE
jgi:creatinine amidohydrolase/Fe(II)-dependent formamide hydrolase-like protein